jgi:hypothetical protein
LPPDQATPTFPKMEETGVPDEEINQPDFLYDGNGCPCFTPSMEQFKDFYAYVKSIEKVGQKAGLIKIIPPQEWIKQQNTSIDLVASYKIKNPISQTFNCGGLPAGVQRQFNIENKKTYTGLSELIFSSRLVYSIQNGAVPIPSNELSRKSFFTRDWQETKKV